MTIKNNLTVKFMTVVNHNKKTIDKNYGTRGVPRQTEKPCTQ